jgi:hypothetical protein
VQTKLSEGLSCLPPDTHTVFFTAGDELHVVALGATVGGLVCLPTNFLIWEEHTVAHVHVGEWVFSCPRASGERNVFFYFHHFLKPLSCAEGFIIFIFNIITIIFLHLNTIKNHVFQQQNLGLGQAGQELYLPALATGALYIDSHAGDVRLLR